jgi:hypothetical protein
VPEGQDTSAHRILTRAAKEDVNMSQRGTMIAPRTTNQSDRSRVSSSFPDDLGGLVDLLPSLRTGEALLVGEAMFVPSRVRVRLSGAPEGGSDPEVSLRWRIAEWPDPANYEAALSR